MLPFDYGTKSSPGYNRLQQEIGIRQHKVGKYPYFFGEYFHVLLRLVIPAMKH